MSLNLTSRAELLEVIGVLVDALRRLDPVYCEAHGVEQVTDEDCDTAIQAGEDALEANAAADDSARHLRVISGTGNPHEQRELAAFIRGLSA